MRLDAVMWPDAPWPRMRADWQEAERLGLGAGWIYDHLFWQDRKPWQEAFTTLAAVAAATTRIGLGTMVTSPNFRHPVLTAKAALTMDDVSGGRFTLALGAGGTGGDAVALGSGDLSAGERAERFAEFAGLTDRLLRENQVAATGRYFSVGDIGVGGGEPRRPPIAVAATGPRGMALAARYADWWITQDVAQDPAVYAGTPYKEVRRQVELLDRVCAEHGRDPGTLARLVVLGYGGERPLDSIEAYRDCAGRYAELGFATIAVLWPRGDDHAMAVLTHAAAEQHG